MKKELIGVSIVGFICLISFFVTSIFNSAIQFEYILSVGVVLIFTISYTWPTILAIRENKRRQFYLDGTYLDEDDEKITAHNFSSFLQKPVAKELFKKYLMSEFSVENILFYEEVDVFKGIADTSLIPQKAKDIIATYILEDAERQVNISDKLKKEIDSRIASSAYTSDMFDNAQEGIIELMYLNSFYRFTQTGPYKSYMAQKNVERKVILSLTN